MLGSLFSFCWFISLVQRPDQKGYSYQRTEGHKSPEVAKRKYELESVWRKGVCSEPHGRTPCVYHGAQFLLKGLLVWRQINQAFNYVQIQIKFNVSIPLIPLGLLKKKSCFKKNFCFWFFNLAIYHVHASIWVSWRGKKWEGDKYGGRVYSTCVQQCALCAGVYITQYLQDWNSRLMWKVFQLAVKLYVLMGTTYCFR